VTEINVIRFDCHFGIIILSPNGLVSAIRVYDPMTFLNVRLGVFLCSNFWANKDGSMDRFCGAPRTDTLQFINRSSE